MKCSLCERSSPKYRIINNKELGLLCSRCYQREKASSITHELPKYGEIALDPEGRPICHICGKAYNKILTHVWQVHELNAYEYKKKFGLDTTKGIMSEKSTKLASIRANENYEISIKENLIINGKGTRFKEGHDGRTKDLVSEQTRLRLIKQIKYMGRNKNVKSSIC